MSKELKASQEWKERQKKLTVLHMEMTISMYLGLERKVSVSTFTKLYNTDIISEEQDNKHSVLSRTSRIQQQECVEKYTCRPSICDRKYGRAKSDHVLMQMHCWKNYTQLFLFRIHTYVSNNKILVECYISKPCKHLVCTQPLS